MRAALTAALLLALLIGLVSSFDPDTSRFDPDPSTLDLDTPSFDLDTPALERRASSTWQYKCGMVQIGTTCEHFRTTSAGSLGAGYNITQQTRDRPKHLQAEYAQIGTCIAITRQSSLKNAFVLQQTGCLEPDKQEKADGLKFKFNTILFFMNGGCFSQPNYQLNVRGLDDEPDYVPKDWEGHCFTPFGVKDMDDITRSFLLVRRNRK